MYVCACVCKYIKIIMLINGNVISKKKKKMRLTTQCASKDDSGKIYWSITLMWDSDQA